MVWLSSKIESGSITPKTQAISQNGLMFNRNKHMVFVSYILCSLIIACGLPYMKKTQFGEMDMEWVTPYHEGDIIVFHGGNSLDTMFISEVSFNNPANRFILDTEGQNWMEGINEYKANSSCDYTLIHNGSVFNGVLFFAEKESMDDPASFSISFGGNYSKTVILPSQEKDTIQFEKATFTKGVAQPVLEIKSITWHKRIGIKEYVLNNGTVFSFWDKKNDVSEKEQEMGFNPILFLLILLILTSCNKVNENKTITIDNKTLNTHQSINTKAIVLNSPVDMEEFLQKVVDTTFFTDSISSAEQYSLLIHYLFRHEDEQYDEGIAWNLYQMIKRYPSKYYYFEERIKDYYDAINIQNELWIYLIQEYVLEKELLPNSISEICNDLGIAFTPNPELEKIFEQLKSDYVN